MIKNILDGYEKILKFNSELDTIRLNNIDELTYKDMISEFNDLLKINYKCVNKFIKKKNITIQSNTPPSNNSDDINNNIINNKIILDLISTITKNNTIINIPNNTHDTLNILKENKNKINEYDNISSISKNNNETLSENFNNLFFNKKIINENNENSINNINSKNNIIINNNNYENDDINNNNINISNIILEDM